MRVKRAEEVDVWKTYEFRVTKRIDIGGSVCEVRLARGDFRAK